MDLTYIIPHRYQSMLSRLPEVSPNKAIIRSRLNDSTLRSSKSSHSSTPDPYMTIKMMKIHSKPNPAKTVLNSFDDFGQYTNSKLNTLIKNSAVTFISPNDFINQIHQESLSHSPTLKPNIKPNPKALSIKRIEKISGTSFYDVIPVIYSKNVQTTTSFNKNNKFLKKKIEITGFQVPKIMRKKQNDESEDEKQKLMKVSNSVSVSKETGLSKKPNPVIVTKKRHKYFKPIKFMPESAKGYFHSNNF